MAIFVALIFQVLFVFFAMIINVGLLVHDKINLQNSLDIAAIYGAQRQAEILNAIAHSNYQIRQSWKLLSFRVRVIGDSGRNTHPSRFLQASGDLIDPSAVAPTVCIDNDLWASDGGSQNYCSKTEITVPQIQSVPNLAPFLPWNQKVTDFAEKARTVFTKNCKDVGPFNWSMAARWYSTFKLDVANRKQVIRTLAANLSQQNFRELNGGEVYEGIKKTLYANLTKSNRQALEENSLIIYNSLAGMDPKLWLNEVKVLPVLYYTDSAGSDSGCRTSITVLNLDVGGRLPHFYGELRGGIDPDGTLKDSLYESQDPDNLYRPIWGVEKNPWYLTYIGLKIKTKPIHPFSPLGKGVELMAKSFAQPFGGRVGPWLHKTWEQDQEESTGDKIDPLAPERFVNTIQNNPQVNVPNFARYPGDHIGLQSKMSLSMLRGAFQLKKQIHVLDYKRLPSNLESPKGDALAYREDDPRASWIRDYELAAISPNIFDVMYYSIDPNFYKNYIQTTADQFFGPQFPLRSDLGFRWESPGFSIRDQVSKLNDMSEFSDLFYKVRTSPDQLLTAWLPKASVDYTMAEDFAHCERVVPTSFEQKDIPVPGSCIKGGRVGYSVKMISENYLHRSDLPLGGRGSVGPLRNPPAENF